MPPSDRLIASLRGRRPFWRGQALAVALAMTPIILRDVIPGTVGDIMPYVAFVPVVLAASLWGGVASAVTSVAICLYPVTAGFRPPPGLRAPDLEPVRDAMVLSHLTIGTVIIAVSEVLRNFIVSTKAAEDRYRALVDASATVVYSMDPSGRFPGPSPGWSEFTGKDWTEQRTSGFAAVVHPDDAPAVMAEWRAARIGRTVARFQARTWHAPSRRYRHVLWRTVPVLAPDGRVEEWIGAMTDIDDQYTAGQVQATLVGELQHRVKNALTVVMGLVRQSARGLETLADFLERFSGRLEALAEAHALLSETKWADADLEAIAEAALRPFFARSDAIEISGPGVNVPPSTATNLVLVFHELATNAIKHGALVSRTGSVSLTWMLEGGFINVSWIERGGPPPSAPRHEGFGVRLLHDALRFEREGSATWELTPDGLHCHLRWRVEGWFEAAAEPADPPRRRESAEL